MSPFLSELLVSVSIIAAQKGKTIPTPLANCPCRHWASSVIPEGVARTHHSPAFPSAFTPAGVNLCPPYFSYFSLSFTYFFKEAETTYVVTYTVEVCT